MCQTPLNVAAGYNNTELVKFLLNQQGGETVDLEAKNMVLKLPHFFCIWLGTLPHFIHASGLIHIPIILFFDSMERLHCIWQWRTVLADHKSTPWTWCTHRNQSQCMIYLFLVLLRIYISAINLLCFMSFDHWISWLPAIFGFFVHRLYVRLSSCENHVFQGLDALTPTLIVGNGLKMVSHVLVMFSVLCTVSLGCGLWVVALLFH